MPLSKRPRSTINAAIKGLKKIGEELALLGTKAPEEIAGIEKWAVRTEATIRFKLERLAGLHTRRYTRRIKKDK